MENEQFKFEVTEADKGKRLDKFLAEKLSDRFSRTFIQKLISKKKVVSGGEAVESHHKVRTGESIDVTVSELIRSSIIPEEIELNVVFEDESLLVINKPAGMVVHPAPGNYKGTLVNALLHHCKDLSGIGGEEKPGIVHRIDKGTSGLIIVAKNDYAHRKLSKQFKNKTIKKVYIALVKGPVELDNGIIDLPIGRHRVDRKKMAVSFDEDTSKNAITRYKVLERFKKHTLLELTIATGRTHQIRVHMSYLGHPLVGDEKYGGGKEFARPALHAKTIGFTHPVTKEYMEFTSELPEDMVELIKAVRDKG